MICPMRRPAPSLQQPKVTRARNDRCRQRRQAMTLLELVAAVAISSIIVLTLMSIYHGTFDHRQRVSSSIETVDRVRGIVSLLSSDLEQMHVYDDRAYLLVDDIDLDGRKVTSIAFPTLTGMRVSEEMQSHPGPMEVAYMVGRDDANPGKLRLFRRELSISINRQETSIRSSTQGFVLLADNLDEMRLEFLPALGEDTSARAIDDEWQPAWQRRFERSDSPQTALPRAAKLTVTAAPVDGKGASTTVERIIRLPQPNAALEMRTPDLMEAMGINEEGAPR